MRFSEIPDELANLPDLSNISTNHKKTQCMDAKWSPILVLTLLGHACIVQMLAISRMNDRLGLFFPQRDNTIPNLNSSIVHDTSMNQQ